MLLILLLSFADRLDKCVQGLYPASSLQYRWNASLRIVFSNHQNDLSPDVFGIYGRRLRRLCQILKASPDLAGHRVYVKGEVQPSLKVKRVIECPR